MIGRVLAGAVAALTFVGATATPAIADAARDGQWYLADLDVAEAQQITKGAGVTVALIDTGVDAEHRDLTGAVLSGYNTRENDWEDSTGRQDRDGHGTHMAGIIAGRGHGSGDGVLGIAPASKILPIAAPVGSIASASFVAKAIDYAITRHVGVINMSFLVAGDEITHDAIRRAQAADIVLVAASGNRGEPGEYPGKYPEVLTVGAYGKNHKISSFSVTGPQVDLTAPGDQMVTTGIGSTGYDLSRGTSDATAVVSGAAALIRAKYPKLSAAEVVHRLTATATDAGPAGRDDTYGFGRLNLLAALTTDVPPLVASVPPGASPATDAAPVSAVDTSDLPKAASPLLLAALLAVVVVLIGAVLLAVMLRRRRTGR